MIKAVLFDLDGVIALSMDYHYRSLKTVLEEQGIKLDKQFFKKEISGRKVIETFEMLLPNKHKTFLQKLVNKKHKIFHQIIRNHVKPNKGIKALLRMLKKRNLKLSLGTSTTPANVRLILGKIGIFGYFDAITTSNEVAHSKPNPLIYKIAAKKVGTPYRECVVIEDAILGIQAAKAANIKAVGITTTVSRAQLKKAGADFVVNSLSEITWKRLEKLGGC